jgi:pilus assembly protein CpaC
VQAQAAPRRRIRKARRLVAGLVICALAVVATLPAGSDRAADPQELVPSEDRVTVHLAEPRNNGDVVRDLFLERGKSTFVKSDYSVKRVSVGNPQILDVVVLSPRELQLVAKAIGTTNLVLWDPKGTPKAAIDVHVGTPHSHLQAELRRVLGNESIKVDSAGESIVLKGTVSSALVQEQALTVARAFFPEDAEGKVINMLEVGGDQQVMIQVTIAEMARSLRRRLGTNWVTSIETGGNVIEVFNTLNNLTSIQGDIIELSDAINLAGNFFGFGSGTYQIFFDILHQKGLGKVLAEPTLVARSGETARFLAGGEVAIPVAQGGAFGSITIEFKEFGVGVSFTPTVLESDRIHLRVTNEVSEPDFTLGAAVGGATVPGFRTRRSSTGIELGDGQSFGIAGLLSDRVNELVDQYPVLGELPVLGALFRSSQFERQESELVMIVTPRLVKPLGPGPHPLPTDHFVEPTDFEFYLLGALESQVQGSSGASTSAVESGGLIGDAGHRVTTRPEGSEG